MMHQPVKDGRGQGGIVVEDARPLLVDGVGGNERGAALIAGADDLEEQIGALLVHGKVSEFVDDQQSRCNIVFERPSKRMGGLRSAERVDDFYG